MSKEFLDLMADPHKSKCGQVTPKNLESPPRAKNIDPCMWWMDGQAMSPSVLYIALEKARQQLACVLFFFSFFFRSYMINAFPRVKKNKKEG